MSCHFGRGVLVGSLVGVLVAMNWRRMIQNCPVYQRIEDMIFDENEEGHPRYRRSPRRCDFYNDKGL